MNNSILNWSWTKPTEEGLYLACSGDVETENNIHFIRVKENELGMMVDTIEGDLLEVYRPSFKFARLCVGAEASE